MEENKKVNPEEVEEKETDCKLTDEELEKSAGGKLTCGVYPDWYWLR